VGSEAWEVVSLPGASTIGEPQDRDIKRLATYRHQNERNQL
jgi:hypothetical protein